MPRDQFRFDETRNFMSALPVTSCRTQVENENNVLEAVALGVSLSVRCVHCGSCHWLPNVFDAVRRVG